MALLIDSDRTLHELNAIFETLDHLDAWINYLSMEIGADYTYFEIQYTKKNEKKILKYIEEMKQYGLKIDYDTMSDWAIE